MFTFVYRTSRRAFTLIELLVVVGIIALLVGILIPALASAKNTANESYCLANMKAWGTGYTMYATSYDDHLPFTGAGDGENAAKQIGLWNDPQYWVNAVPAMMSSANTTWDQLYLESTGTPPAAGMPNRGSKSLFVCPTAFDVGFVNPGPAGSNNDAPTTDNCFTIFGTVTSPGDTPRDTYWCYVTNSKIDNSIVGKDALGHPLFTRTNMKTPWSASIFIAEKMMNPNEVNPANTSETLCRAKTTWSRFAARHKGGGNLAFVDGHAEWFALNTLAPPTAGFAPNGTNTNGPDGFGSIPGVAVWDPFNGCW